MLAITIGVLIAAWRWQRRERAALFYTVGLLAVINVAVAVFWT